jgi:hypothetical protein
VLRRLIGKLDGMVVIVAEEGFTSDYNGLKIVQTRDYVHIHIAPLSGQDHSQSRMLGGREE